MNAMLVSGGYPWTIIQVKERKESIEALEICDVEHNIVPFVQFVIKSTTSMGSEKDKR